MLRAGSPPAVRRGVPAFADEALEPIDVDRFPAGCRARIPARRVTSASAPSIFAQLGDEVLQRTDGGLGRLLAPELVDEPVGRHDFARAQREEREQGTLLLTAHFEGATVDADLERPE